jgi:carboxyl-terminal processing protease
MLDERDDYTDLAARRTANRWLVASLAALAGSAALILWLRPHGAPEPVQPWDDDARRELQGVVESRYVDPVDARRADELFDAAMRGYVEQLDPFSRYFSAEERSALDEDTSGTFGGIGVRVDVEPNGMLVVAVRRGGPAEAAGIVPGDTIERVGDVPVIGRTRDEMIDLVKGPPSTPVTLWVLGAGAGQARRVEATRALVELDTVPAVRMLEGVPRIGYVRVAQFTDTTAADVRAALRTLASSSPEALVLDLRRNLGGVVQAAVDVAALFLPPDTLVCSVRSRDGLREHRTEKKDGFEELSLPLVVLTDGATASASEILAGALQDHGRAVVVGDRTYGKFVMQTIVPLGHRGAALRLTTAHYLTPLGRSDQRDPAHNLAGGLMPDVRVPLTTREEDVALREGFGRQCGLAWNVLPGRERGPATSDRQLAAAVALLRGADAPAEPVPARTD